MVDIISGKAGKNNTMLTGIVSLAITVCIIILLVKIYKAMAAGTNAVGQQIGNQTIAVQTGVPAARISYLRDVAVQANKGVYRIWGINKISWVFDDDVVAACNLVNSAAEAALVSRFYKENTGDSLRYDVIESSFMVDASRKKITHKLSFS